MNSGIYEAMVERMNALEARITELEARGGKPENVGEKIQHIRERYPVAMSKSKAAELLGVCRCTVYNMIGDGRLTENGWRRITTDSLCRLMAGGEPRNKKGRKADE